MIAISCFIILNMAGCLSKGNILRDHGLYLDVS